MVLQVLQVQKDYRVNQVHLETQVFLADEVNQAQGDFLESQVVKETLVMQVYQVVMVFQVYQVQKEKQFVQKL